MKNLAASKAIIQTEPADMNGTVVARTLSTRIEALKDLARGLIQEVEALKGIQTLDLRQGINIYDEVRRYEIDLISRALKITGGHQAHAARLLGLNVTTLNSKIKRYHLQDFASPELEEASPAAQ